MTQKIGFLGLDAAGKTSFLSVLSATYSSVIEPKPTKGIQRSSKDIIGQKIDLWDYGGQEQYRDRYLSSEKQLEGLDLVFYLVDIQDKDRIDESGEYLSSLLEKMQDFDQSNLIVCFHKYDPDLRDTLKDQLKMTWKKMENKVEDAYAFVPTSIFDERSIIRAFSMGLRKIATQKEIIEQELLQFCKEIGTDGAVVLSKDGLIMASCTSDGNILEKIENAGISLATLCRTKDVKFDEITGKTDFGEFRFDNVSTDVRGYYILVIGTTESYDIEKMKRFLKSLG
ncbi:MAG: ADP-ribosylation factor-like protein [Candidatus Odinarchaeota archaeon]